MVFSYPKTFPPKCLSWQRSRRGKFACAPGLARFHPLFTWRIPQLQRRHEQMRIFFHE
jgi:hypothetical protein